MRKVVGELLKYQRARAGTRNRILSLQVLMLFRSPGSPPSQFYKFKGHTSTLCVGRAWGLGYLWFRDFGQISKTVTETDMPGGEGGGGRGGGKGGEKEHQRGGGGLSLSLLWAHLNWKGLLRFSSNIRLILSLIHSTCCHSNRNKQQFWVQIR